MASSGNDELSMQDTGDRDVAQLRVRPLTATEASRYGKVKVYDRSDLSDSRAGRFRQSYCRCHENSCMAVIQQHAMSSLGMECRLTHGCADDDPFVYVFVEALQLLQDWLSEDRHFTNALQVALWEKRENIAGLLRSFCDDIDENRTNAVPREILYDVLKCHKPCLQASTLFSDMPHSQIEAMITRLLEESFELLASRFDDHVLEARAAARRDVLKCIFHVLSSVITDHSYFVDVLSTALDIGHESIIRNVLQKVVTCRRRRRGRETGDICQKLFNAAVRNGNPELVRILLQLPQLCRYVDVNSVIDATTGDAALHLACRIGSTLINQTFDDCLCSTAARLLSLESENSQRLESVLSLSCPPNYYRFVAAVAATSEYPDKGLDAWMLLAMSSEMQKLQLNVRFNDYVELAHSLIRNGADIHATNREGETALHVAASHQLHGNVLLEIYALCRTHVFEQDMPWKRNCCLLGSLKTLQEKNLQKDETEALFTCIARELFSSSAIQLLYPVVLAYFDNVTRLIRILLQAGVDINLRTAAGQSAVLIAADEASRCVEFCRQMCTTVGDQVHESAVAVGELLRANIFTVAKELLIYNADLDIGKSKGISLLNLALNSNQTDLLVELVCQAAEPVSWPEFLLLVFESENQSVVKKTLETLSSIGVTVDTRNEIGQTALHIAAERDLADVVSDLIHVGADTAAEDDDERTPLKTALERGCSNSAVAFRMCSPEAELSNTLIVAAEEESAEWYCDLF